MDAKTRRRAIAKVPPPMRDIHRRADQLLKLIEKPAHRGWVNRDYGSVWMDCLLDLRDLRSALEGRWPALIEGRKED